MGREKIKGTLRKDLATSLTHVRPNPDRAPPKLSERLKLCEPIYGVWSGHWAFHGMMVFHTSSLAVARAQAMGLNEYNKGLYGEEIFAKKPLWEARAIGEDGLPSEEKGV